MIKLKFLIFTLLTLSFTTQAGVGLSQTRIIIEELGWAKLKYLCRYVIQ